jgi:glycosyltransferase involved in cell wall biosynthesis
MKGKILFLAKYGARAASTRYRFLQYFPYLREKGWEPELSPLLPDAYLESQYAGRRGWEHAASGFARRWGELGRIGDFRLAVLNYEAFPYLPAVYERILAARLPYVLDLDDAIFERYRRGIKSAFLGGKIGAVMRRASLVIAGNEYLAQYARASGAKAIVIPTVVDTEAYLPRGADDSHRPPWIGWVGSPSTAPYLRGVEGALGFFAADGSAHVRVIGAGSTRLSFPAEYLDWREEEEIQRIRELDLGIMPLPDDPWTKGKCGFKLIQYMACGLPVVASPVGVNREIVVDGENGFWAQTEGEWRVALARLLQSAELRRTMGEKGRRRVVEEYSLARWRAPFVQALATALR